MTTYQSVFSKVTVPDPDKLRNAVLSGKRAVPWYRRKSTYGGIAAALACIAVAVLVGRSAFPHTIIPVNTTELDGDTTTAGATTVWTEGTTAGATTARTEGTTAGAASTVAGTYGTPADLHVTFTLDCTLSDKRRTVTAYAELPNQANPVQQAELLLDKFGMNLDANDYTNPDGTDLIYDDGVYNLRVGPRSTYILRTSDTNPMPREVHGFSVVDNSDGQLAKTTIPAASTLSQYKPLSEAEYLDMVAAQLDAWGITLPEGLEMNYYETEVGCNIAWDANDLYNEHAYIRGYVRMVYFGDKFHMLEYALQDIPSCGTQEIISEQEAYARLPEESHFWCIIKDGTALTIDSCTLDYSPITTNDPEPVYIFHTLYNGSDLRLMVPAKP